MNGCIEWTGRLHRQGYGLVSGQDTKSRTDFAHRVAWREMFGPIPDDMVVMHICDNPPCVNPEHLRLGTQRDNVDDMDEKGRRRVGRGERQHLARLTDDAVRDIRLRFAHGARAVDLATEYGVHRTSIYRAVNDETWRHVVE